jgi:hypothetical protein
MTAQALARYDAMCRAIAECHRIDEVKDIRDKSKALEIYAVQVKNIEAERKAYEVRLRAERRMGDLLKELARSTPKQAATQGGRAKAAMSSNGTRQKPPEGDAPSPYAEALQQTGISRQAAHRYQALANVPQETFEQAISAPDKSSPAEIIAKDKAMRAVDAAANPAHRMPSDSLWIWGRLRDLERGDYFSKNPEKLLAPMTEPMQADMLRLLPPAIKFLSALKGASRECL